MTPRATLTSTTATGDVVTGPGYPFSISKGLPSACMGDLVTGAVCVGAITVSTCPYVLMGGRPVAQIGAVVSGANPITGIPVATAVAVSTAVNLID